MSSFSRFQKAIEKIEILNLFKTNLIDVKKKSVMQLDYNKIIIPINEIENNFLYNNINNVLGYNLIRINEGVSIDNNDFSLKSGSQHDESVTLDTICGYKNEDENILFFHGTTYSNIDNLFNLFHIFNICNPDVEKCSLGHGLYLTLNPNEAIAYACAFLKDNIFISPDDVDIPVLVCLKIPITECSKIPFRSLQSKENKNILGENGFRRDIRPNYHNQISLLYNSLNNVTIDKIFEIKLPSKITSRSFSNKFTEYFDINEIINTAKKFPRIGEVLKMSYELALQKKIDFINQLQQSDDKTDVSSSGGGQKIRINKTKTNKNIHIKKIRIKKNTRKKKE